MGNFKKHLQNHMKDGIEIDIKTTLEEAQAQARRNLDMANNQPVLVFVFYK